LPSSASSSPSAAFSNWGHSAFFYSSFTSLLICAGGAIPRSPGRSSRDDVSLDSLPRHSRSRMIARARSAAPGDLGSPHRRNEVQARPGRRSFLGRALQIEPERSSSRARGAGASRSDTSSRRRASPARKGSPRGAAYATKRPADERPGDLGIAPPTKRTEEKSGMSPTGQPRSKRQIQERSRPGNDLRSTKR
jgi:hypothetical protein